MVFFLRSLDLFWMYLYHAALTHFCAREREIDIKWWTWLGSHFWGEFYDLLPRLAFMVDHVGLLGEEVWEKEAGKKPKQSFCSFFFFIWLIKRVLFFGRINFDPWNCSMLSYCGLIKFSWSCCRSTGSWWDCNWLQARVIHTEKRRFLFHAWLKNTVKINQGTWFLQLAFCYFGVSSNNPAIHLVNQIQGFESNSPCSGASERVL